MPRPPNDPPAAAAGSARHVPLAHPATAGSPRRSPDERQGELAAQQAMELEAQTEALAEANAALARTSALLGSVLATTPDVVAATDRDGRHLLAKAATARVLGRPVADIVGRTDHELHPAAVADALVAADRAAMAADEPLVLVERAQGGTPLRRMDLTPPEEWPKDARALAALTVGERVEPFVQVRRQAQLRRADAGGLGTGLPTGASQHCTGLGLAIGRDLARGTAGDLLAESTVGGGSTFRVVLRRVGADDVAGVSAPPGAEAGDGGRG